MLYRGECKSTHEANGGRILPKNVNGLKEVVPLNDGMTMYDGRFTRGHTEENRVQAHQIESGLYGGCSVSTTRSYDEAKKFALYADDEGVVYCIDDSQFSSHGVVAIELESPAMPSELEVTIRSADGGEIPPALILRTDHVSR